MKASEQDSKVVSNVPVRVLVVDDDMAMLRATSLVLKRSGFEVTCIGDAVEGMAAAQESNFDVAVFDIKMPNLSGIELLTAVKKHQPEVEVILMSGHATIRDAMDAVRLGAYDVLTKPFDDIDVLSHAVSRASERKALLRRNTHLENQVNKYEAFEGLVGRSEAMRRVYQLIEAAGQSNASVLIRGESGTGKELVARALHQISDRRKQPFLAVNCSALTDTLLESELFGHIKGAFTGAVSQKTGLFEAANGGTLFLDEIGDISPATQVRLLRVLQEGEIKRVGAVESTKVNVRIIAATHVDLEKLRKTGKFRDDLFYRLNVITIPLPALRERPEDIVMLSNHS
jgi:two-component system response regulator HydG